ncbi:MAG: DUF11 domain-containing protein, partial [Candidatus Krumholzibacteria bacterium]|nr:DUF11 domain-containing protein [Candidatus Krumholzibacteria bacterium]
MRRSLSASIFLVIMAAGATSAFAEGPVLSGEMVAHRIVMDEDNREIAVSAEQVYPQDMVEYTLRYSNTGDSSASGVDLVGPVPSGTAYLEKTASDIEGMRTVFSIDEGETYHQAPVMYEVIRKDGTVEMKTATPGMITHIKWS